MGRRAPWRSRASKRKALGLPLDLIIFALTISILVFTPLTSFIGFAAPGACQMGETVLYGNGADQPGLHTLLLVICGLIGLLICTHAATGLIMRQKFSITACMFGILNLVLLVLATRQIGYSWAFFHPDHPIAQHLHAQARPYVIDNVFSLNEENWTDPLNVFYDERAWECVDQNEYGCIFWNEGLKLTARPMLVSQCYSPELIRKNWAALNDRPFPENHSNTLIEYVYFDSQNRWIRPPGFLRPRTHELQQHLAPHQLNESTPGWWLMQDLLYEQYLEREKAEAEKLRPYTRREIDMLVARNWGDERPVWWQDE